MFQRSPLTHKKPLIVSGEVSIAAGASGTATITVPSNELFFIKSVEITKGADITVSGITIDGIDTEQTATFNTDTAFGSLLTAERTISASGSNAGLSAQTLAVKVIGVKCS